MSRHSRRGLADLIVMIVMIVALLGMGVLAFITYDKAQKEKQYLSALRELPNRQQSELDAVRARYAEVTTFIGFKGEAAYSEPSAIIQLIEDGSTLVADFYEVPNAEGAGEPLKGTVQRTIRVTVRDPETGEFKNIDIPYQQVANTTRNATKLYESANIKTLQAALGEQDNVVNELVSKHIPNVRSQRDFQKNFKDTAAGRKASGADTAYDDVATRIKNSDTDLRTAQGEVANAERELADALKKENTTYLKLDSDSVREAREAAFAAAREAAIARRAAREAMEAMRLQSDKRRLDDTRDPDGAIFLVDQRSGYCWINIGQGNDVKKNQTFSVIRANASQASETQIGEIRVVEVMRGNIARCRVDQLEDPSVYPEAGDIIRNPNFSARQYHSWALVGEFGGNYTTLTRQQLTELLRGFGYRVTTKIDSTTDAVIIGGNWVDDPEFIAAEERRLSFERYPEKEVLWFLGMIGPDRKN